MNGLTAAGSDRNYPSEQAVSARKLDITLRQNIDEQLTQAEARVEELKQTKDRMERSGILDMRIDDIQRAMRW